MLLWPPTYAGRADSAPPRVGTRTFANVRAQLSGDQVGDGGEAGNGGRGARRTR